MIDSRGFLTQEPTRSRILIKKVNFFSIVHGRIMVTIEATQASDHSVGIRVQLSGDMHNSSKETLVCGDSGCGKVLSKNSSWVKHFGTHLSTGAGAYLETSFVCSVGDCIGKSGKEELVVSFRSIQGLRQHYRKCHATRDFSCGSCSKTFSTAWYFKNHEVSCGVRFHCSTCPKAFDSLETLRTHARRLGHQVNLDHYTNLIRGKSTPKIVNKTEKLQAVDKKGLETKTKVGVRRTVQLSKIKLNPATTSTQPRFVSIVPKPPVVDSKLATAIFSLRSYLKVPFQAEIGTQTAPQPVRKRSASQHCQTESKLTKTTGTITFTPSDHPFPPKKRKASAQTQTKKLKISAETQTPVVTKRKICTRRLQLSSITTQTVSLLNGVPPPRVLTPVDIATPFCDELLNETHIETQTDPNPFFGYPNSPHRSHSDIFLPEETELGEDGGAKTIETQTSPRRKAPTDWGQMVNYVTPPVNFDFALSSRSGSRGRKRDESSSPSLSSSSLVEDLDKLEIYLETMDSETQTNFNFF